MAWVSSTVPAEPLAIGVGEKGVALVGVDRKPVGAERNELP